MNKYQSISCILPVYNNQNTVENVLKILLSIKLIDEVIVIDDGSTDNSYQILEKYKQRIKLIKNKENLGKGGAFIKGYKLAKGKFILTCDADHQHLRREHLEKIINQYFRGKHHMVLGARESDKGWGALMAKITGERMFERKSIEKYLDLINGARYGMEQIINHAHKGKNIKVTVSKDIGHILKYKRGNVPSWLKDYLLQIYQMSKTAWALKKYKPT